MLPTLCGWSGVWEGWGGVQWALVVVVVEGFGCLDEARDLTLVSQATKYSNLHVGHTGSDTQAAAHRQRRTGSDTQAATHVVFTGHHALKLGDKARCVPLGVHLSCGGKMRPQLLIRRSPKVERTVRDRDNTRAFVLDPTTKQAMAGTSIAFVECSKRPHINITYQYTYLIILHTNITAHAANHHIPTSQTNTTQHAQHT